MSAYRTSAPPLEEPDPFPDGPVTLKTLRARGGDMVTLAGYPCQIVLVTRDEHMQLYHDDWFVRLARAENIIGGSAAREFRDILLEERYAGCTAVAYALGIIVVLKPR